jgi:hypothetical protein
MGEFTLDQVILIILLPLHKVYQTSLSLSHQLVLLKHPKEELRVLLTLSEQLRKAYRLIWKQ